MKLSIFSLFRDSEKTISDSLERFSALLELAGSDAEFFFYENDSQDNTRQILSEWVKDKPAKLFYEDLDTPKFGSVPDVYRLVLLSYYRNKLKRMTGDVNSDFSLLVDSDIVYDNSHVEMLIEEMNSGWGMVTPNVRQYQIPDLMFGKSEDSFYDTFAMRDSKFNNVFSFTDCPLVLNPDRELWKQNKPVEVCSGFGGLAVVISSIYNKCEWSTNGHSEHVNFCSEIRRYGNICVLPSCKPQAEIDLNTVHKESVLRIAENQVKSLAGVNEVYEKSISEAL